MDHRCGTVLVGKVPSDDRLPLTGRRCGIDAVYSARSGDRHRLTGRRYGIGVDGLGQNVDRLRPMGRHYGTGVARLDPVGVCRRQTVRPLGIESVHFVQVGHLHRRIGSPCEAGVAHLEQIDLHY